MTTADAFLEMFDRMPDLVREAVGDLPVDDLAWRPDADANSVAWLVWHLTRVQDDHVAGAAAALGHDDLAEQVYVADGFAGRFDLPFPVGAHGYGHTSEQVSAVRAEGGLLAEYHHAVHARTQRFLRAVTEEEWSHVVDDAWDPPVTLLVRMASVAGEVAQHVGQAAYVRGLAERR